MGEGTVRWTFRDDYGCAQNIRVKAYHVPTSNVRLFSPQSYFAHEQKGSFHMTMDGATFTFGSGSTLTFKYSSKDYLPTAYAHTNHAPTSSSFLVSNGQLNISKP